jgi:uncharacterized protein (TIGR00297 family)
VIEQWISALVFASAAAFLSRAAGFLTRGGAVAEFILALVLFGCGGWQWTLPVVFFFIPSSVISRARSAQRDQAGRYYAKGPTRDAVQVVANGGMAGLIVIAWSLFPLPVWYVGFLSAIGAAAADTWGTEIGVLSAQPPRMITTWRIVERGVSGGVTPKGIAAGAAGAALVFVPAIAWIPPQAIPMSALIVLSSSLAGSLVDSLLGATLQAQHRCQVCGLETERPSHCCKPAARVRGLGWVKNDMVNGICTVFGGLLGCGLALII